MEIEKNTVSAVRQVKDEHVVQIVDKGAKLNVLFIGNSITRHAPKESIGWSGNWGMAASCEERDYVHVVVAGLEEKYGPVNFCTVCGADWERSYWDSAELERLSAARNFKADIIVCRIGENIWGSRDKLATIPLEPYFDHMIKWFNVQNTERLVITDLFWAFDGVDSVIRSVAAKNGYTLVGINDLGAQDCCKALGQFWHDGVQIHPNDEGMKRIAERILEKL